MALTKSEKNKLKKSLKKISPLTIFLIVLFLALGIGAGWFTMSTICKNDAVELLGTKEIVLTVGTGTHTYTDEGIKAIAFGKDISSTVKIESNIGEPVNGVFTIDLTTEGDYYIKYTISHFKFGEVVKYRTIIVEEVTP